MRWRMFIPEKKVTPIQTKKFGREIFETEIALTVSDEARSIVAMYSKAEKLLRHNTTRGRRPGICIES